MNFEDIKIRFDKLKEPPFYSVSPKQRGVINSLLDKACHSKENRYQFAIALGMLPHSKDWSAGEWFAVSQMVKIDKEPALGWHASEKNFESIVRTVLAKIGANENQISMFEVIE